MPSRGREAEKAKVTGDSKARPAHAGQGDRDQGERGAGHCFIHRWCLCLGVLGGAAGQARGVLGWGEGARKR